MKRVVKLAGWLIFGVVVSAVLFVLIASFLGWRFDVVPTKSMEPAFNAGGMVVTQPVKMEDVKIGDAILFREPNIEAEARICHRVIDIKEVDSELFFQTKGDANEYADSDLVSPQNFIGKTIYYLPGVGNIAYLFRLHEAPITLMGSKISVAFLIVLAVGMSVIGMELNNMLEWTLRPHVKRRQEILKRRKARFSRRKRRFS